MKRTMTALAVVLLAGTAAPAMAQGRGDHGQRFEGRGGPQRDGGARDGGTRDGGQRDWGGGRRDDGAGRTTTVREAPQAPAAPQAAQPARGFGHAAVGEAQRRADRLQQGGDGGRNWQGGGDRRDGGRGDGDRRDGDRRDGGRGDGGRGDGGRAGGGRGDGDHRDWQGRGGGDRQYGDRGGWNRGDPGRNWDGRNWDRRGDDGRRWQHGRYPTVYASAHRYRHTWRPPQGFYVRSWAYGEFLPRGWFAPGYWIDAYAFDLPLPPPGFAWVRSGDDALLVDEYNGRVVQVVRDVFW